MKGVLMAGGEGSRLRPLTSRRPKPLAPVASKPVMEHIVDLLRRHGITEIVATLHYLADEIETYFGDGADFGVTMEYVVEDTPLGTAGAVKMADKLLAGDSFLVISGDALTDIDLDGAGRTPRREGNDVTIALQRVTNPLEFGVVVTDEAGRITRFLEKPSWGEVFSDTINTGIYVLEPEIFDRMEARQQLRFLAGPLPRDAARRHEARRLRHRRVLDRHRQPATVPAGELRRARRHGAARIRGHGDRARRLGRRRLPHRSRRRGCTGRSCSGDGVRIDAGVESSGRPTLGNGSIVEHGARIDAQRAVGRLLRRRRRRLQRLHARRPQHRSKERVRSAKATVIGRGCTIGCGATVNAEHQALARQIGDLGIDRLDVADLRHKWPGSLFGRSASAVWRTSRSRRSSRSSSDRRSARI